MSIRGGSRPGAGRKTSASPFGEKTVTVRVPESRKGVVLEFLDTFKHSNPDSPPLKGVMLPAINPAPIRTPRFGTKIRAGFPSPADDYVEERLDLNEHLIKNPPATFMLTVEGCSMIDAGIFEGDIIIVDRSLTPKHNDVVVAVVDGEHTVKRLYKRGKKTMLVAENPQFLPIELKDGQELLIIGVVTSSIHSVR